MTHVEFIRKYLQDMKFHIKNNILVIEEYVTFVHYANAIEKFEFPDNIHFLGPLCIERAHIQELSNNFTVDGTLYALSSSLRKLPDDLCVNGDLDIDSTSVTELPNNFTVNSLDIRNTRCSMRIDKTAVPDSTLINNRLI